MSFLGLFKLGLTKNLVDPIDPLDPVDPVEIV